MIRSMVGLSPEQHQARWARADYIHGLRDIDLPRLQYWNYEPCARHLELTRGCPWCGGRFYRHQRVGASWLYMAMKGLLSDPVGTGKTLIVIGLLAMMKEAGELGIPNAATVGASPGRRAIIVATAAAVPQWREEFQRFAPALQVSTATGTIQQRATRYLDPWEVMIISPETLRMRQIRTQGGVTQAGDMEMLLNFDAGTVIYDDVDAMRNEANKTFYAIDRLAAGADRVVGLHATPLQKRVTELWCFLAPAGGREMFGPLSVFRHNHVPVVADYYETKDRFGRTVIKTRKKEVGVKNGPQLKSKMGPLVLRRRLEDIDDLDMPSLVPREVWLDPSPEQKRRYAELARGVLRRVTEEGESLTRAEAMTHFMHGWQICSGLATLDSVAPVSVKLDWCMDRITGDMAGDDDEAAEKAVCFVNFKPNVVDLSRRLAEAEVGHVLMWGDESNARVRTERLARFREDPQCRVLIGTTTIERSLNLQSARHLIAVDTILNPARMKQIAGRIQRVGSVYQTVYFHQLLLRGTQEAAYPGLLQAEQAVADYVFGEQSDMFPALSPLQLMRLISGDPALTAQAA